VGGIPAEGPSERRTGRATAQRSSHWPTQILIQKDNKGVCAKKNERERVGNEKGEKNKETDKDFSGEGAYRGVVNAQSFRRSDIGRGGLLGG